MKKLILLSVTLLSLAACKKEEKVAPKIVPVSSTSTTASAVTVTAKPDTIPDNAIFRLKLVKDSDNYDETMFMFNHTSSLNFSNTVDAPYFAGYGEESLASLSHDGVDLAINTLPYTSGMSVGLDAGTKASGNFSLQISYEKNIPANVKIWVKDTFLKDSVDVRTQNYNFNVNKADAGSSDSKRFVLIIKDKGQQ